MAKRRGNAQTQAHPPGKPSSAATAERNDALDRARAAFARGDLRSARRFAAEALGAVKSPEARAEADELLAAAAVDRGALLAAAVVLVTILIAAWVALLSRH